jgi:hypothetical protein
MRPATLRNFVLASSIMLSSFTLAGAQNQNQPPAAAIRIHTLRDPAAKAALKEMRDVSKQEPPKIILLLSGCEQPVQERLLKMLKEDERLRGMEAVLMISDAPLDGKRPVPLPQDNIFIYPRNDVESYIVLLITRKLGNKESKESFTFINPTVEGRNAESVASELRRFYELQKPRDPGTAPFLEF